MTRPLFVSLLSIFAVLISDPAAAQRDPLSIPCDQLQDHPDFINADTLPATPSILPETLSECLAALDEVLNPYQRRFIACLQENEVRDALHYGFGTWIRNEWRLWAASPLRYHFLNRGVLHPEDMSAIILMTYYRKLTGRSLDVDGQIAYYRNYWLDQGVDIDSLIESALKNEAEIKSKTDSGKN